MCEVASGWDCGRLGVGCGVLPPQGLRSVVGEGAGGQNKVYFLVPS